MAGKSFLLAATTALLTACANIECPLDNVVMMQANLYNALDGKPMNIEDYLSVYSAPKDTLLLNQAQNVGSFMVPVRHGVETDTLLLNFSNIAGDAIDTLFVSKTDIPHFESVDCPATFFHHLQKVGWTSHSLAEFPLTIDSVVIISPKVDYDDKENIRIYLRTVATER